MLVNKAKIEELKKRIRVLRMLEEDSIKAEEQREDINMMAMWLMDLDMRLARVEAIIEKIKKIRGK